MSAWAWSATLNCSICFRAIMWCTCQSAASVGYGATGRLRTGCASRVPYGDGSRIANPLNVLNRWKILDNLRRSLLAPAMSLLLILAWFLSPAPAMWGWLVAWTFLCPHRPALAGPRHDAMAARSARVAETGTSLLRALLFLALLPHQAWLNHGRHCPSRGIGSCVSHRLLLEWETASEAHRRSRNRRRQFVINMAWVTALSAPARRIARRNAAGCVTGRRAVPRASGRPRPCSCRFLNREVRRGRWQAC